MSAAMVAALIAIMVVAIVFVGLAIVFSLVMCRRYPDAPLDPPEGFEPISVPSDDVELRGWLLPSGDSGLPVVLVVPGLQSCIASYVEIARGWNGAGHTTLLLEPRGHGMSGGFPTLGARESLDVRAAMDWLRARGLGRHGFVLSGWSLGAVAVLRGAVGEPDVRAVIAEAPYHTLRRAVRRTARLMYGIRGWWAWPVLALALKLAERRGGFSAVHVDAAVAAARLRAPLFVIADAEDPWMPEATVRRVYAAHAGPKRYWLADGADHVEAVRRGDYWPRVRAFVEECLDCAPAA